MICCETKFSLVDLRFPDCSDYKALTEWQLTKAVNRNKITNLFLLRLHT